MKVLKFGNIVSRFYWIRKNKLINWFIIYVQDITNENSYKNFIASIQNIVGENGLNLLINNAGVSPKSTRVNFVKLNQMTETILTNSIAPLMFTKVKESLIYKRHYIYLPAYR